MKRIEKIIAGGTAPVFNDDLWLDTSDINKPQLKMLSNGTYKNVGGGGSAEKSVVRLTAPIDIVGDDPKTKAEFATALGITEEEVDEIFACEIDMIEVSMETIQEGDLTVNTKIYIPFVGSQIAEDANITLIEFCAQRAVSDSSYVVFFKIQDTYSIMETSFEPQG